MKKYIMVTGGELANKGAQAMTLITADEISKRWPDCEMVLVSARDAQRTEEEKKSYRFRIIAGINWKRRLALHIPVVRYFARKDRQSREFYEIARRTEAVIDISGFAIGDPWKEKNILILLLGRIADPVLYGTPVYFMPQSFGPFDFKGKYAGLVMMALRHYLPKANVLMAREEEGRQALKQTFSLRNVVKTDDLVLQNRGIDVDRVLTAPCLHTDYGAPIAEKAVAIVPNSKNLKYLSRQQMQTLYRAAIEHLLSKGAQVFLIDHSSEDHDLCRQIKTAYFARQPQVVLVEQELSCLDFDEFVRQMTYIIASRYHSIVHAYKRAVPAIGIGWAVKYRELMHTFSQDRFQADVRKGIDVPEILRMIDDMDAHWREESKIIEGKLALVQRGNVYDRIRLKSELAQSYSQKK